MSCCTSLVTIQTQTMTSHNTNAHHSIAHENGWQKTDEKGENQTHRRVMHPIQKQVPVSKHNLKQLKHQEKKWVMIRETPWFYSVLSLIIIIYHDSDSWIFVKWVMSKVLLCLQHSKKNVDHQLCMNLTVTHNTLINMLPLANSSPPGRKY